MRHSLLSEYITWYEQSLPYVDGMLPPAAIVVFGALSARVLWARGFDRISGGFLVLNVAATLFVVGACLAVAHPALLACCLACLCAYVSGFGVRSLEEPSRSRWHTGAAVAIVVASTALKLAELESWPPLLNDYGARTGVEAYSKFAEAPWRWICTRVNPYLFGGGTSVLHAPLVMLSFQLFGYSIYAVRFAELLGSIAALSFFWLWLRAMGMGAFGLVALGFFAFSSEHLSNSRMGTFYSISQAVALSVLWIATRFQGQPQQYARWLFGLTLAILLIPCTYGPVRVLFIFTSVVLLLLAAGSGRRLHKCCVLLLLCVGVIGYGAVTLNNTAPFKTFSRVANILATDTPIWFKADTKADHRYLQPPAVIASNLKKNTSIFFKEALTPNVEQESIYSFGVAVLLCCAALGVWTARWRVCSAYVICGFVPLLVTYPLLRRGIVIRPLIPALLALFMREYVSCIRSALQPGLVRAGACLALAVFACTSLLHGSYFFAKYNSPIGTSPSFGPLYARSFYDHLKTLVKDQTVVVLNPGTSDWQYKMEFPEFFMSESPMKPRIILMNVSRRAHFSDVLPTDRPLQVAVLNESRRSWIIPALREQYGNVRLEEFSDGGSVMFWIATIDEGGVGGHTTAR